MRTLLLASTFIVVIAAPALACRGTTEFPQAFEQLEGANANVMGVVLNRLSTRSDGYYKYYYYRHAYYLDEPEEIDLDSKTTNGRDSSSKRRIRVRNR